MKIALVISGLMGLALNAVASDVTGHALITKRLTKKSLSPVVYNLRGPAVPVSTVDPEPANEFDRMVVILEASQNDERPRSKPPVNVMVDQEGMRFHPDVVVVPAGSTVQFPNSDPIFHNIFSLSKAQSFDLGYYPQGQSRTVRFSHPGIVQVYCHIHANMYAAIVVTASPWFSKPSADGSFRFSNVPAGHYRLTAWHKIAGLHRVNLEVPQSGAVNANIRVPIDTEQ